MRGPFAKVREQPFLALLFGAEFQDLLFPQKIKRQGRGDGVRQPPERLGFNISWQAGEQQGVAGLVEFDQLALLWTIHRGLAIVKVIHQAVQKRLVFEKLNDPEGIPADGDNIHAAIVMGLDDFQNFRCAADPYDTIGQRQQHSKRLTQVYAFTHHAAIARLENVQGELLVWKKDDVEGKKRNAFRPHSSDPMIANLAGGKTGLSLSGEGRNLGDKKSVHEIAGSEAGSHGLESFQISYEMRSMARRQVPESLVADNL